MNNMKKTIVILMALCATQVFSQQLVKLKNLEKANSPGKIVMSNSLNVATYSTLSTSGSGNFVCSTNPTITNARLLSGTVSPVIGQVPVANDTQGSWTWSTVASGGGSTPTITGSGLVSVSGSNPNFTITGATPSFSQVLAAGNINGPGTIIWFQGTTPSQYTNTVSYNRLVGSIVSSTSNSNTIGSQWSQTQDGFYFNAGWNNVTNRVLTTITPNSFTVNGSANFPGIQYGRNYSGYFTTLSLIHKGYVDSVSAYVTRIGSTTTQAANPTINVDRIHWTSISSLAQAVTSVTMTGTPYNGQLLEIDFSDNGTIRTLAFGSQFYGSLLPTATVVGKTVYAFFRYVAGSTNKWLCVGSLTE
jgi:hypothetical protein